MKYIYDFNMTVNGREFYVEIEVKKVDCSFDHEFGIKTCCTFETQAYVYDAMELMHENRKPLDLSKLDENVLTELAYLDGEAIEQAIKEGI